jgi:hypothetical protein
VDVQPDRFPRLQLGLPRKGPAPEKALVSQIFRCGSVPRNQPYFKRCHDRLQKRTPDRLGSDRYPNGQRSPFEDHAR